MLFLPYNILFIFLLNIININLGTFNEAIVLFFDFSADLLSSILFQILVFRLY